LIVLLILLLSIPLDAVLHLDIYGKPKLKARLVWLFSLVSKEVSKDKKPKEKRKEVKAKPGRKKKGIKAKTVIEILQTKGLLRNLIGLISDILRCPRIKELEVDFVVGLNDPADTGLLFAFIGPATVFFNHLFHHMIRIQPSFDEAVLEGYSSVTVRLQPVQLVPAIIRFVFSFATIRAIKILILSKWKEKK
jgi:hypothetical protein